MKSAAFPFATERLPERAAVIDLEAIRHNVRHLANLAAPAQLMAVVKADAYGHGVLPVARAALEAGADWLGVAHISEALALRAGAIDVPMLAWLHTTDSHFRAAIAADIDLGCSGWELPFIVAAAQQQRKTARIHLKFDSGLGRNGSTPAEWAGFVARARQAELAGSVTVVGVFSHLAVADEPSRVETDEQIAAFTTAVAQAREAGLHPMLRHLANSAGVLTRADTHFDLVRAGLAIYGLSPFGDRTSTDLGLRPAMTLRTLVSVCKDVPAEQGVSYGLNYRTTAPTTLALIPLGYADGIPRVATGGPVRIGGVTYRVVGHIAMDQMVIDLGVAALVASGASVIGTEAVLFGPGDDGEASVDEWAAAAGTINYEVVTRISPRVPRVYRNV
ncbi:alanine racemase [Cryobacterium sp. PH31-O1]|uniref:alanine racemase n=1 Tax=Cryobacterium sp. PH31-O1 TaxID=3046306 RepID=UPI0024BB97C5|nr:alanine racemase [Cryobacterium sp. PH31-O1]MDJ0338015.1 alanine racemase [Cryobacterium sp. PH31-O1]